MRSPCKLFVFNFAILIIMCLSVSVFEFFLFGNLCAFLPECLFHSTGLGSFQPLFLQIRFLSLSLFSEILKMQMLVCLMLSQRSLKPFLLKKKKTKKKTKKNSFSLIPGLGMLLEEGIATHSSVLAWRIPMDRGAWWATVHGVTKSWTLVSD